MVTTRVLAEGSSAQVAIVSRRIFGQKAVFDLPGCKEGVPKRQQLPLHQPA